MFAALHPALHEIHVGEASAPHRVVFLHGLFGRGKNLLRLAQGLEPEAQSLLLDLPNHGSSEWTETFDFAQIADTVAAHLRADFAAGGPVDVVGHSMGGKVAMVLALRHPDVVRRLTVIDISPVHSDSSRSDFAHLLSALSALNLADFERRSQADVALSAEVPNDAVRSFLLQNLRYRDGALVWDPNLGLLYEELPNVMTFPEFDGQTFTGPVLWLKGDRSPYIKDVDGPVMRSLFPRAKRITIRDAGHWVHSEKPAEVIAALRLFLLPRAAGAQMGAQAAAVAAE